MLKRWLANLGSLLAWLVVCALGLVVIAVAANFFQVFLVMTMKVDRWSIRFWVQLYYILAGLIWLGLVIFVEHLLFSESSRDGLLLPRSAFIIGIELIAIGVFQFLFNLYGTFGWLEALLTLGELVAGAALIWYGRRKPGARLNS
jgi:hypothetical protein